MHGFGELQDTPSWHLYRVSRYPLEGDYRADVLVELGDGGRHAVDVRLSAQLDRAGAGVGTRSSSTQANARSRGADQLACAARIVVDSGKPVAQSLSKRTIQHTSRPLAATLLLRPRNQPDHHIGLDRITRTMSVTQLSANWFGTGACGMSLPVSPDLDLAHFCDRVGLFVPL
jgi:hypothetical protein